MYIYRGTKYEPSKEKEKSVEKTDLIYRGHKIKDNKKKYMEIFELITDVGAPIAGALLMGVFIFIIIKQIMDNLVDDINTVKGMSEMLITRGKVMNNDIIRIDTSVSAALGLAPDLQRLARAENFVEDGTIDARRD